MKIIERANGVLQEAEAQLRKLIVEAAQQSEYTSIEVLARWASSLNEMATAPVEPEQSKSCAPVPALHETFSRTSRPPLSTAKAPGKKSKRRNSRSSSYPKFARSGDTLIKIAWSKAQKCEYRHKSPRSVLAQLVNTLSTLFADTVLVSMESVLPLESADGNEIPDYQTYLCLAWMKSVGVVEQKGREGYIKNEAVSDLPLVVNEAWNNLPNNI